MKYQDIVNLTKRQIREMSPDDVYNLFTKLSVKYRDIEDYLICDDKKMTEESFANMYDYVYGLVNNVDTTPTQVYKIKVDKIMSYNELFDVMVGKGAKNIQYNQKYLNYNKQIYDMLASIDKENTIKDTLNSRFLHIEVEFIVNYRQKDLDNILKPFIDALFKYGGVSDNKIKSIKHSGIYKNEINNDEYIAFRLRRMTYNETANTRLFKHFE